MERYKNVYCHSGIYFMLKTLNINIVSDYMITYDNECFYIEDDNISGRDCAYRPSVYEIFEYIRNKFKYDICINQLSDNKWEWYVNDLVLNKIIVYSGETESNDGNTAYNLGKNFEQFRKYYDTESEAIDDAITELILLI